MHGLILFEAAEYNKAAAFFLKTASALQASLQAGLTIDQCSTCSLASKGRPNFVNRPYLLYKAGRCHAAMGDHDKAFALLGTVPFRQRTLAIHYDFGRECQRRGKRELAVASFKEVLRANPYAIELISPMVRLGADTKELEALLCSRSDVHPTMAQWLQAHIRAEAAAKASQFPVAIELLLPLVSSNWDNSQGGEVSLPPLVMDSCAGVLASHSCKADRSQPSTEPNQGVFLTLQLLSEHPFCSSVQPYITSPGASQSAPLFAFGHTFVAERIMAFAAEAGAAAACTALNKRMAVCDPFGMPGTESLAFALSQEILSPNGHSHGAEKLAAMCAELKTIMSTWQSNRQASASWVVASLLCLVQGDTHNAIRFVNTALQCDAYDELAMTVKGHILLEMGSLHAAANHFFTSDTRNPSLHCAAGVVSCYVRLGSWQLALTHATNAVSNHAQDHRAHTLLGDTLLQAIAAGADADCAELRRFDLTYMRAKTKVRNCYAVAGHSIPILFKCSLKTL